MKKRKTEVITAKCYKYKKGISLSSKKNENCEGNTRDDTDPD